MQKVKILFVAANPQDTPPLQLDKEIRAITEKIRASEYRDLLELTSVWAARPDDLLQGLNVHKPDIVHFSGHGSKMGEIMLVDSDGQAKPVTPHALRALFTVLKDKVQVVLLNACYSRAQARTITSVIDCAIGMKDSIGDRAAVIFAASFYRAIGFGRSIAEAFNQAKVALMLEGIPEDDIPKLLVRKGIDASKVVLIDSHDLGDAPPDGPEVDEHELTRLKYICYLSFGKINNLFGQIPILNRRRSQQPPLAIRRSSYAESLLNLICSGIQYGGRERGGGLATDDDIDPIFKLSQILKALEESEQISDLNKLISLNEKVEDSTTAFFTYHGVFRCLAPYKLREFLNIESDYVKRQEEETEYSPIHAISGLRTTGGMSILHSECDKYTLYMACSYKYFSDMGGSRVFVEGQDKFSKNDLVAIHPHSGNWLFFSGKHDATFDMILVLTGQKGHELYGSPLVIVNAFSPDFTI